MYSILISYIYQEDSKLESDIAAITEMRQGGWQEEACV